MKGKNMKIGIQQGDVWLKKCGVKGVFLQEFEAIPEDAKPVEGKVLYYGDNNTHAFESGKFQMFEKDQVRFLRVTEPATLSHGEHGSHVIEPGEYFLDIVREYDHLKEESRRVID